MERKSYYSKLDKEMVKAPNKTPEKPSWERLFEEEDIDPDTDDFSWERIFEEEDIDLDTDDFMLEYEFYENSGETPSGNEPEGGSGGKTEAEPSRPQQNRAQISDRQQSRRQQSTTPTAGEQQSRPQTARAEQSKSQTARPQHNTTETSRAQQSRRQQGMTPAARTVQSKTQQNMTPMAGAKQNKTQQNTKHTADAKQGKTQTARMEQSKSQTAGKKDAFNTPRKKKKSMKGVLISLLITVFLLLVVAAGFYFAFKYSNSKKYMLKRDSAPPVATVTDVTIFDYETVAPEDFLSDIKDDMNVTVTQLTTIDYSAEGEQTVQFRLEDEAGNSAVYEAKLTVIHDVTPPVIISEPWIRATIGQSVAYKSFLVVRDDYDPDPEITVDNSGVDLSKEGWYPISYTATDKSGNSTTVTGEVAVSASHGTVSDDEINSLVDQVLSQIITDDMDELHKVWAVYEYVKHIPYAKTDYSFDYKFEGYRILHDNYGDCFGSYSATKLLLDRLGITNIPIETNGNHRHYWNMVSIDDGKTWYHVDATQWTQWWDHPVMCMISTNEINRISEEHFGTHRFDVNAYPKTPDQNLAIPDDIYTTYSYDF